MHYFDRHYKNQDKHFIKIHGQLAEILLPISIVGHEGFSEPFCYNLKAFVRKGREGPKNIYGNKICCEIKDPTQSFPARFINGVITNTEYGDNDTELIVCNFKIEPDLALLKLSKSTRVWKEKSVPDIISTILNEYNIRDIKFLLYKKYTPLEYCIQYRESDYDFIYRILSEVGIYYYFIHSCDEHVMVFADHKSAHSGTKETELYLTTPKSSFKPASIDEWHISSEIIPGEFSISGYDMNKAEGFRVRMDGYEYTKGLKKIHFGDISPLNDREILTKKISTLISSRESNTTFGWGKTEAWWLSCGERFKLKTVEAKTFNYYVFSLSLKAFNDYDSESGSFSCQIQALDSDINWCPLEPEDTPVIPGILIAKVIGPEGEEIHTDAYGRVKIQFPWEDGRTGEQSSCWVRVSQCWSGFGAASQFIPRVGTEVFVSFIQGDPNCPVIIGSVYNGKNKPPLDLPKKKNISGFVTKSIGGGDKNEGHRFIFDDTKGDEKISITSQKDFFLIVNNDAIHEIKNKHALKVLKGRSTQIESGNDELEISQGNVNQTIAGDFNIKLTNGDYRLIVNGGATNIKSDKSLMIESIQSLILKVGSNKIELSPSGITITGTLLKLEGKATTEVKGTMLTVQGSAITQIKGGIINIG
ncbi:type VI secretion system tip protein TssI/VgrG [Escherichia coli]|nr:type VI secretion system tip protein TssI/VgrG [Escherichia coli]